MNDEKEIPIPTFDAVRSRGVKRYCYQCGAFTKRWIRWSNAAGAKHWFCDNDCLTQWIARQAEDATNGADEETAEAAETVKAVTNIKNLYKFLNSDTVSWPDPTGNRWCHASCCSGETNYDGSFCCHDAQLVLDQNGWPHGYFGEQTWAIQDKVIRFYENRKK
jgi:hypothetical protein